MSALLLVLRISTVLALGAAIAIFLYTVGATPSKPGPRLGLRGLKRQKALATNDGWSQIEPLVRWLGIRVSRFLNDEQRKQIDDQLTRAGDYLGLTADEYLALSVISSVAGLVVGCVLGFGFNIGGGLTVVGGFALGTLGPYVQVGAVATERLLAISRGLPGVIDVMALSMGAGKDFPGSIREVIEKSSTTDDPIIEEFILILQSLSLGRTRRDALMEFSVRAPVEAVKEFVNSLVQAEERGNPVAEVLSIQASVSRGRRSVRAEEAASKAGIKLLVPVILVFFTVVTLLLGPAIVGITKGLN